eukprot:7376036-Prymnesium_polylepis.1
MWTANGSTCVGEWRGQQTAALPRGMPHGLPQARSQRADARPKLSGRKLSKGLCSAAVSKADARTAECPWRPRRSVRRAPEGSVIGLTCGSNGQVSYPFAVDFLGRRRRRRDLRSYDAKNQACATWFESRRRAYGALEAGAGAVGVLPRAAAVWERRGHASQRPSRTRGVRWRGTHWKGDRRNARACAAVAPFTAAVADLM